MLTKVVAPLLEETQESVKAADILEITQRQYVAALRGATALEFHRGSGTCSWKMNRGFTEGECQKAQMKECGEMLTGF
jgi:hypothetical protein